MSSVPSCMRQESLPRWDQNAAAIRVGKSARSHVMVSPREVASLWPPDAALSHGRIFHEPSSRCWGTANRVMPRHESGEPKISSTSPMVYGPLA
eukprot:6679586-Prymnesium_polylepis.1